MKWRLWLVAVFSAGCFIGYEIADGRQETYFEANDVSHFFFRNPVPEAPMNVVVSGDWETVCVNPSQPLDPSKKLFGTVVDEGLLDYLSKIVVLHSNGDWGIMNFDERYYAILSEKECMPLHDVWVKRTVATSVDDDPDGIPFAMTTFELRQTAP